jgi:hypothetical protein
MDNFLFSKIPGSNSTYYEEIDFIKAIAIIAVIILHTGLTYKHFAFFAPLFIQHAVPVFIIIAGINSSLSIYRRGKISLSYEYSLDKFKKYFQRILIPFSIVWLFEIMALIFAKKATVGKIFFSFFAGGIGPGNFYTPVFIQHLIFFPLVIWLKNKFSSYNQFIMLLGFFFVSIFLEWMCIVLIVPEWLYSPLYLRYLFAAVIGSYMVSHEFSKKAIFLLMPLSITYIISVSYLKYDFPTIIYSAWGFQHAPAYFYTAFLVYFLWWIYPFLRNIERLILPIGKASYHIFLFQMMWFWFPAQFLRKLVTNDFLYLSLNIFACLLVGYVFYKIQLSALETLKAKFANNKIRRTQKAAPLI